MIVYVETSALLRWLFSESDAETIAHSINSATGVVTSVLTMMESERIIIRSHCRGMLAASGFQAAGRTLKNFSSDWELMEVSPLVRSRVGQPFPLEPIRTLDAIHLASALDFSRVYPDFAMLTRDRKILDNAVRLGIPTC